MQLGSDYKELIDRFWKWTQNFNEVIRSGNPPFVNYTIAQVIREQAISLSAVLEDEYPFYSKELTDISRILFRHSTAEMCAVNIAAFGELFLIIKNLKKEPYNLAIWHDIHPRVQSVSLPLYSDGHFGVAAEKAIKEVEQVLREIFVKVKPTTKEPKDASDIVGALLSENGAYPITACLTPSEKSFSRGAKLLFDGFLASYRNPTAHGNRGLSKRESLEQIVFSSQLLFILDKGEFIER